MARTKELRRRFETAMGHVDCRQLTGMDLGVMERFLADLVEARGDLVEPHADVRPELHCM